MLLRLTIILFCLFGFSRQENQISEYNFSEEYEKVSLIEDSAKIIDSFLAKNKTTVVSVQCWKQLLQYSSALLRPRENLWALKMLDAGTKGPQSGILNGNIIDLGHFDQCLSIEKHIPNVNTIFGKYCLGMIPVQNLKFWSFEVPETRMMNPDVGISAAFATCLPSSCSTTDIEKLYSVLNIGIRFQDNLCQSKNTQPELTDGVIASISFFAVIFFIMLISTFYDVFLYYNKKESCHTLLIAFSIFTNGKKLVATTNSNSQIACLHGIRVISMMWIILGHRYGLQNGIPKINSGSIVHWLSQKHNMFIMGVTVSVDTFFLLSGILVAYSFMTAMSKGVKFNIIAYYIHRYLRLTPLLAATILMYVTILQHLGSGPLWHYFLTPSIEGCKEYWWSAFIYIQNYLNPHRVCLAHTWYLSVDTQLFLISPIILIPLKKWPKIGFSITGLLLIGGIIASFLAAWFNDLYGFMPRNQGAKLPKYMESYYLATHTRAGPWLIGIIMGYYIHHIKYNHTKIVMGKLISLLMWAISLAILGACVFGGHNTITNDYDRVLNSFYVALLRPGWALGVSWVIFACVIGYGGLVNWFLSTPMFQVVSKLTYSMYLLHIVIELIITDQLRTTTSFSNLQTLYIFWGDFAFALGISLIFTLAFESPVIAIEKVIFGKSKETKVQPAPPIVSVKETA